MDTVDAVTHSRIMPSIRGMNTGPELVVRKYLHARRFLHRIHRSDLSSSPDTVPPKLRACLFVHGCFWHKHVGCRYAPPYDTAKFWNTKFQKNVARDLANFQILGAASRKVLIIWECQLKAISLLSTSTSSGVKNCAQGVVCTL